MDIALSSGLFPVCGATPPWSCSIVGALVLFVLVLPACEGDGFRHGDAHVAITEEAERRGVDAGEPPADDRDAAPLAGDGVSAAGGPAADAPSRSLVQTLTAKVDAGGAQDSADVSEQEQPPPSSGAGVGDQANVDVDAGGEAWVAEPASVAVDSQLLDAGLQQTTCEVACVAAGGECVGGTCRFNCESSADCPEEIRCPDDHQCLVECGAGACSAEVECPEEANCLVHCDGADSCSGRVHCNGGPRCEVSCKGDNSCSGGVVGGADEFALHCAGVNACSPEVSCNAQLCAIRCEGQGSCDGSVLLSADESVLRCTGGQSCTSVTCNSGACDVGCESATACNAGVTCHTGIPRGACAE